MTKPTGGTVASIYRRDKRKCWVCGHGVREGEASRDHMEPRSLGGYNKSRNYRLAHMRCNTARGLLSETAVRAVRIALPLGFSAEMMRAALLLEARRLHREARRERKAAIR